MRVRGALLVLILVPAALFSLASTHETCTVVDDSGTEDSADDVLACQASTYLSCKNAANGKVYSPLDSVPLDLAAPTASVADGAGCGKAEIAQARGTATTSLYDLNTTGYVAGNVDTLTVELHSIYAAAQRASGSVKLDVRLVVGGVSPVGFAESGGLPGGSPIASPRSFTLSVDPEPSATGASEALVFTITDIHKAFPELSEAGVGAENYQTLDVTVSVENPAWVGTFVMGTTEVPSNVTINGPVRGTEVSAVFLKATSGA